MSLNGVAPVLCSFTSQTAYGQWMSLKWNREQFPNLALKCFVTIIKRLRVRIMYADM